MVLSPTQLPLIDNTPYTHRSSIVLLINTASSKMALGNLGNVKLMQDSMRISGDILSRYSTPPNSNFDIFFGCRLMQTGVLP